MKATHGLTSNGRRPPPEYEAWANMKARCSNPNHPLYKYYGGRGITVCDRWSGFANFYDDMGRRPAGKTLDRIDNTRGYSPDNCRWSTPKEQANNRRNNRLITHKGETLTMAQWAHRVGVNQDLIYRRLGNGWDLERALHQPSQRRSTKRITSRPELPSFFPSWAKR